MNMNEELHESHIDDDVARQQEQEKLIQPTGSKYLSVMLMYNTHTIFA